MVFVEHGGKTTLVLTMRYESQETRDGILKSPMETRRLKSIAALQRRTRA